MRIVDLCCGAGGAAMGLHQRYPEAEIVGVDIAPQPRYPFAFVQGDALAFDLNGFDFAWASWPCQAFTQMSARYRGKGGRTDRHLDLITPGRRKLEAWGGWWIMENVTGAARAMRPSVLLHGGMFGLGVHRPRFFESNFLMLAPQAAATREPVGVFGARADRRRLWTRADGSEQRAAGSIEEARAAMAIDWMDWSEITQAVPPAYSHYLAQFIPIRRTICLCSYPHVDHA